MNYSDFDLNYQNQNIDSKIVAALERISQVFRVLLWEESRGHNLTPLQIQILTFLLFHSKKICKVSYLAQEFNLTKATVSETVRLLEIKTLIEKITDKKDTRSYTITLTEKGKELAQKTSIFSNQITCSVHKLSFSEKENVLYALLNIIYHLNQLGLITIQRMCLTCKYYEQDNKNNHYCHLLEKSISLSDLRVDCPDHINQKE